MKDDQYHEFNFEEAKNELKGMSSILNMGIDKSNDVALTFSMNVNRYLNNDRITDDEKLFLITSLYNICHNHFVDYEKLEYQYFIYELFIEILENFFNLTQEQIFDHLNKQKSC